MGRQSSIFPVFIFVGVVTFSVYISWSVRFNNYFIIQMQEIIILIVYIVLLHVSQIRAIQGLKSLFSIAFAFIQMVTSLYIFSEIPSHFEKTFNHVAFSFFSVTLYGISSI